MANAIGEKELIVGEITRIVKANPNISAFVMEHAPAIKGLEKPDDVYQWAETVRAELQSDECSYILEFVLGLDHLTIT